MGGTGGDTGSGIMQEWRQEDKNWNGPEGKGTASTTETGGQKEKRMNSTRSGGTQSMIGGKRI